MPICPETCRRVRSIRLAGFVFVVRVRVRYGILDHVCTDTITRMPPCVWIFLISLQEISLQPEKEEI